MWLLWTVLAACDGQTGDSAVLAGCEPDPGDPDGRALSWSGEGPTHLIGLSIDTLRRASVGRYAGSGVTPFLDGLLEGGVALDDARTCANWTLPGVTCALTGQTTLEQGFEPLIADKDAEGLQLPVALETLATWLGQAGFASSLVSASKLFSHHQPVSNGFDTVVFDGEVIAAPLVDAAVGQAQTLRAQADGSTYLHVHFRDPHGPYAPPESYQGDLVGVDLGDHDPREQAGISALRRDWPDLSQAQRDELLGVLYQLYDGELRYLDDQLSRLWTELDGGGLLDDTLVVIWSDHGEQFFEHSDLGHGRSLHPDEADMVAGFWGSGLDSGVWTGPVGQPDLVPTILDALGVPIPETVTGQVIGTSPADRVRVSGTVDTADVPIFSADRAGWRMTYAWDGDRALYDLEADPGEQVDVYRDHPATVHCLWEHLEPQLGFVDRTRTDGEPVRPGP